MTNETNQAKDQARAQLDAILEFMAAINCDYDRLEELRDMESEDITEDEKEELVELEKQAGEYDDSDSAREAAQDNALELSVRSDWQSVGETLEPSEYLILLCTGGPAVRIIGELTNGEPDSAVLQFQDWGTRWTAFFDYKDGELDSLLEYARLFYFGE